MKLRIIRTVTVLFVLVLLLQSIEPAFGENENVKELTGGKINKIKVIYATDGYMIDSGGSIEYFIFGAVQINKRGSPENEWGDPLLYFEFKNKRTFAGVGKIEYFSDDLSVKRLYTSATDYNYAKYNRSEHAAKGLSMGATPHEFELDFIFNKDGTIDIQKSSMGVIPDEYKTGRTSKSMEWNGEYYKKGSDTEKVEIIRNETGSIVNMDELGDPVEVEGTAMVDEVCFDFYGAISPAPSPTFIKENGEEYNYEEEQREELEKENPSYHPIEDPPREEAPPAPDVTDESSPDPKETPFKKSDKEIDGVKLYKPTGLCSMYKVYNISHSQPIPNGEVLGVILKDL